MDKNILNPEYYWNNLYNPTLVRYLLGDSMRKSFYENCVYQKFAFENYYLNLKDFKNDEMLNRRYKLPEMTLHYEIGNITHSKLCPKEVYINNLNKVQSIENICYDENFYVTPLFFIDGFLNMNINVIFLPNSIIFTIDINTYNKMIQYVGKTDIECRIELRQRDDMFKPVEKTRNNIFNDTYIEISEDEYYDGRVHNDDDYVDIFISDPDTGLIYHTMGIYSTTYNGPSVNIEFKRFILNTIKDANKRVRIWFFGMPYFTHYIMYEHNTITNDGYLSGNSDMLVSASNISVYEFNIDTFSIGKRMNIEIEHIFPTIYNFGKGLSESKTYIVVYAKDYTHEKRKATFFNQLRIYTNEYAFNYSMQVFTNTLPDAIKNFKPEPHVYDYNDFMTDRVFPDIRAYDFNKYMSCLLEFPVLMNLYLEAQHKIVRFQYTLSSNNKIMKIVSNRTESSTLFITHDEYSSISLPVDSNYIKFTNYDDEEHNIELFINGLRALSYHEEPLSHVYYVIIPKSISIDENSEISMTICNHILRKKCESEIIFTEKGEILPFPDSGEFGDISLGDIIFIDKETGEYIDPGDFGFSQDVDKDIIENPYDKDEFAPSGVTDIIHLLTQNTEYYATINKENIILNKAKENIPAPPNFVPNESNKVIDSEKLHIECTDEKYLNKEIIITNTTEGGKYGQITDCSDSTHNHKIIFSRWTRDPSRNRFRAYHNGYLLKDSDYDYIPPEKYGGDAIFDFSNFTSGNIIVDYIPYREDRFYDGPVKDEWIIQNEFLLIDISQFVQYGVCAQMLKIWINGMFISVDRIYDTHAFGYVVVDLRGYANLHRITMYADKIDTDCMENNTMLDNDINRKFIEFCIDEEHTILFRNRILETAIGQKL